MNLCRSRRCRAHISRRWNSSIRPLSSRRDAATLERGSAAVELVLLAPLLVALLVFVVYAGRITQANARVHHAADQAARAASMVSRARSGSVAAATATAELTSDGVRCASSSISSSRSSAAGLDAITVTVSCTIDGSDLAPLAPGRRTVVATSTEVIDVFRAEEP